MSPPVAWLVIVLGVVVLGLALADLVQLIVYLVRLVRWSLRKLGQL